LFIYESIENECANLISFRKQTSKQTKRLEGVCTTDLSRSMDRSLCETIHCKGTVDFIDHFLALIKGIVTPHFIIDTVISNK